MRHLNIFVVLAVIFGFMLTLVPIPVGAESANVTIIASQDTFLHSLEPTDTHDTAQWNVEGSTTVILRPILEFDLSSIPADCTIQSANLYAYYFQADIGTPAGRTYNCRRLLRTDFEESEATWNVYKTGSSWTTAGANSTVSDYTLTDSVSAVVPALNNWTVWNVTAQVNWAYTNSTTADFRLSDNVENSASRHNAVFRSSEAVDTTKTPRLEVVYELPPWDVPVVTTDAITGFGNSWAVGRGTITDIGSATVTQIGIDYGLTAAYGSSKTESVYITGGQSFSLRTDGLSPATQYFWRAKAYNGEWGYGGGQTFYTSGSDTLYEYLNTGDDARLLISGPNWYGQTFTTNATVPHTISQIRAKLYRGGSPGTVTAQVFRTSGGVPTGLAIGSGDIDGDTFTTNTSGIWYPIPLDEEVALQTNTTYAVTLDSRNTDGSNNISWRYDYTSSYAGGTVVNSTSGGGSWSTSGNDTMFEIWGNPALQILGCNVYENLMEDGDQLFIFSYQVIPPSAYDSTLAINYFHTQLLIGSTLEAQAKLPAWEYRPAGFYLDADYALPWNSNLTTIRIAGITGTDFAGDEAEYILTSTDWVGVDLNTLDDWIITAANAMGTWYGLTFTGVSSIGDYFLYPDGTALFTLGIPGIENIRPDIFSVQGATGTPVAEDHDTSYAEGLTGGLGPGFVNATEDLGDLLGVSGELVGSTFWVYIIVMGLSVGGATLGPGPVALICAGLPLAFLGGALGAVPLAYILLPVFILGVVAILKLTRLI